MRYEIISWVSAIDSIDIPDGAVRLAGSALYPNQAFKYGDKAYAFQFHIEVNKKILYDWC